MDQTAIINIQWEEEGFQDAKATFGEALPELLQRAGQAVLSELNLTIGIFEVSIRFLSKEEICRFNKTYREKDVPTDVLSFPMFLSLDEIFAQGYESQHTECVVLLGDVAICADIALEQAEEYGHSAARELVYLFVHSMLHLLGFNHESGEEKREMREMEEIVMTSLDLTREESIV